MNKWLAILVLAVPFLAHAYELGERVKPWTLNDQFEHAFTLNAQTQLILVARNMDQADLVKQALADKPKGYLEQRNAVFVADITRMPKMVSKLFALPAMRKYNYRVMLDRDGTIASQYSQSEQAEIYWLEIKQGVVLKQQSFANARELAQALEQFNQ